MKDFVPLENVDKSFDLEIKGEQIFGKKGEDGKLVKIGKVLASKHNIGIALIDLTKLDKLGSQVRIFLDDYKVMLWQPTWLDMVLNVDYPVD